MVSYPCQNLLRPCDPLKSLLLQGSLRRQWPAFSPTRGHCSGLTCLSSLTSLVLMLRQHPVSPRCNCSWCPTSWNCASLACSKILHLTICNLHWRISPLESRRRSSLQAASA